MHAQVTYSLLVHFMEPVSKKNLLDQKQIIGFWKKKKYSVGINISCKYHNLGIQ